MLAISGLMWIALTGCGEGGGKPTPQASASLNAPSESGRAAERSTDPMEVRVRADMSSYFKLGRLEFVDVSQSLDAVGRIEADPRLVARIGSAVSGRVIEVFGEVGQAVRKGQTLAEIASPELTAAQLNYLRAFSTANLSERAVDRARQLLSADVIGSAELQRRESELMVARAELGAAGDQLLLMGVTAERIAELRKSGSLSARLPVPSSISGVIIERKLSTGQVAQPGDSLFTVADLSSVWVVGALPEQAARYVKVGQTVEMEVAALRGKALSGRISQVGDIISPDTRTVEFRTEVANPQRELKPMMMVSMRIVGESQRRLAVPVDAVVREGDRDHVFLRIGKEQFRLVPVDLGPAVAGLRPVRRGLQEGSEIVVAGAFHLNNERRRAETE